MVLNSPLSFKHVLSYLVLLHKDSLIDPQLTPPNHQTLGQLPWVASQLLDDRKVSSQVNDGKQSWKISLNYFLCSLAVPLTTKRVAPIILCPTKKHTRAEHRRGTFQLPCQRFFWNCDWLSWRVWKCEENLPARHSTQQVPMLLVLLAEQYL